jgi:FRG domain
MCKRVSDVQGLLGIVREFNQRGSHHSHLRLWFRGHADAGWKLIPGIFRENIPTDKAKRLRLEQHLSQDFRVQGAGLIGETVDAAKIYFLQQHYRMPTRLLDWTHNPLAALYFAASEKEDADGKLFVMDAYQLGPSQNAKWLNGRAFEGIVTSRSPLFKLAISSIFQWKDEPTHPDFIVPVRPDHSDRRIALQRSCFTFHPELPS